MQLRRLAQSPPFMLPQDTQHNEKHTEEQNPRQNHKRNDAHVGLLRLRKKLHHHQEENKAETHGSDSRPRESDKVVKRSRENPLQDAGFA